MAYLDRINSAEASQARGDLWVSCHSNRWADAMTAARPFSSAARLFAAAEKAWSALGPSDWREAFAFHCGIRDTYALREKDPTVWQWSKVDEAGLFGADKKTRAALLAGEREYEAKFGHKFIFCAAGKSAAAFLATLRRRLANGRQAELLVAAQELRKIMRRHLKKDLQAERLRKWPPAR